MTKEFINNDLTRNKQKVCKLFRGLVRKEKVKEMA